MNTKKLRQKFKQNKKMHIIDGDCYTTISLDKITDNNIAVSKHFKGVYEGLDIAFDSEDVTNPLFSYEINLNNENLIATKYFENHKKEILKRVDNKPSKKLKEYLNS